MCPLLFRVPCWCRLATPARRIWSCLVARRTRSRMVPIAADRGRSRREDSPQLWITHPIVWITSANCGKGSSFWLISSEQRPVPLVRRGPSAAPARSRPLHRRLWKSGGQAAGKWWSGGADVRERCEHPCASVAPMWRSMGIRGGQNGDGFGRTSPGAGGCAKWGACSPGYTDRCRLFPIGQNNVSPHFPRPYEYNMIHDYKKNMNHATTDEQHTSTTRFFALDDTVSFVRFLAQAPQTCSSLLHGHM